ncbi:hypothetical protein AAF712_011015 [Marasmius tenuissimus]|uniref:Uncharacterized protein n=1 Tax=Marasmius tenuissimus TaxID=585030 RepID=A0ABR2ZMZ4_9AGAR
MSATTSYGGGAAMQIFMMILVLLVGLGVGAKWWFYPFTMDKLEREIGLIWELIEENTTRRWDLLGPSGWELRKRLYQECDKMVEIESRSTAEPDRWNLRAWFVLQWREMKDVKKCYLSLMAIKKKITTVIESRKRHLFAPANQSNPSNIDDATATVITA